MNDIYVILGLVIVASLILASWHDLMCWIGLHHDVIRASTGLRYSSTWMECRHCHRKIGPVSWWANNFERGSNE